MDLADCGSPESLVDTILGHHPEWSPPVPVEKFAMSVNIKAIEELETEQFEGALITDAHKREGVILHRARASTQRRRFTIGHELGHFLIPSHKGNKHCTKNDFHERRVDTQYRRQEAEANRFSAGLLMPSIWFLREMYRLGEADIHHVKELADHFGTSIEATINRYIELTDDNCAFVFSRNGRVRYARRSSLFPHLTVRSGDPLPKESHSPDIFSGPLRVPSSWFENDGSVWLGTSFGKSPPPVLEQSFCQGGGFQVSLLFISTDHTVDEDEEELEESWEPRFRR